MMTTLPCPFSLQEQSDRVPTTSFHDRNDGFVMAYSQFVRDLAIYTLPAAR